MVAISALVLFVKSQGHEEQTGVYTTTDIIGKIRFRRTNSALHTSSGVLSFASQHQLPGQDIGQSLNQPVE